MKIESGVSRLLNQKLTLGTKYLTLVQSNGTVRKLKLADLKRALMDKWSSVPVSVYYFFSGRLETKPYVVLYSLRRDLFDYDFAIGCQRFDRKTWDLIRRAANKTQVTPKRRIAKP